MEHREESEAQEEGETERHAAATEEARDRGAQRYPSDNENACSRLESAKMHYVRLMKRKTWGGTNSVMTRLKMRWTRRPLL